MDETFVDQVDQLLHRYDQRKGEHQERLNALELEENAFLAEFAKFRALTAYPLFETVAEHLREYGHDFDLEQPDYDVSEYGRTKDASITLTIYPVGTQRHSRPVHELASFSITASKITQLVRLHRNVTNPRGGASPAPRGELKLSMLTPELVQRELLKLLGEVFGTPRT